MEEMLTIPGAARKTANVVLGTAYGIASGVVVDTHVQRIAQPPGSDQAHRPGEDRAGSDEDHPAGTVDSVFPPDDPARPRAVRGAQAEMRRVRPEPAVLRPGQARTLAVDEVHGPAADDGGRGATQEDVRGDVQAFVHGTPAEQRQGYGEQDGREESEGEVRHQRCSRRNSSALEIAIRLKRPANRSRVVPYSWRRPSRKRGRRRAGQQEWGAGQRLGGRPAWNMSDVKPSRP